MIADETDTWSAPTRCGRQRGEPETTISRGETLPFKEAAGLSGLHATGETGFRICSPCCRCKHGSRIGLAGELYGRGTPNHAMRAGYDDFALHVESPVICDTAAGRACRPTGGRIWMHPPQRQPLRAHEVPAQPRPTALATTARKGLTLNAVSPALPKHPGTRTDSTSRLAVLFEKDGSTDRLARWRVSPLSA